MCITEGFSNNLAFSLLLDLEIAFNIEYSELEEIRSFYTYQIDIKFKPIMKDLVSHYSSNPKKNKSQKLFSDIDIMKDVEYHNVGKRLYLTKIKSWRKTRK